MTASKQDVIDLLRAGREVAAELEWTRGAYLRDAAGRIINLGDETGEKPHYCCARGATLWAIEKGFAAEHRIWDRAEIKLVAFHALDRVAVKRMADPQFTSSVHYNDKFAESKADILSLYDEAIASVVQFEAKEGA